METAPNLRVDLRGTAELQQIQPARLVGLQQRPDDSRINGAVQLPVVIARPVIGHMLGHKTPFRPVQHQVGQAPRHVRVDEVTRAAERLQPLVASAICPLKSS